MDNAASVLVDAPVDEGRGGEIALAGPDGVVTRREFLALTDRAARGLAALGVERQHRVALLMPDGAGFAAAFLGAIKLGAVAVPLNTRLGAAELARLVCDAEARVLIAAADLGAPVAPLLSGAAQRCRVVAWEELLAGAIAAAGGGADARLAAAPAGPDTMAFWLYTSGTTGTPKAAVHCHRTLLAGRRYGAGVLGVGPGDRIYATSKLFFAYALGNALLIPLQLRAQSYLTPEWPGPARVAAVMGGYRPTLFFSVPTFYARALAAELPPATFASARACVSAGERLPREIAAAWRARFGVEILDGLGAIETVFYEWFDLATEALFDSLGLPWPVIFPQYRIVGVPIVECGASFAAPVRYGDRVRIRSTVTEVGARTFRVAHEVGVGATACASGFEVRAWVAAPEEPGGRLRSRPLPEEIARRLRGEPAPGEA